MKKLFSGVLLIMFTFLSVVNVNAANISINSEDININKNRLFDIVIEVDSNVEIAAATYKIKYDNDFIEFRSASAEKDGCIVRYKRDVETSKVVILAKDGLKLNKTEFISFEFKSLEYGTTDIEFVMYDCVDKQGNEIKGEFKATSKVNINSTSKNYYSSSNNKNNNYYTNQETQSSKVTADDNNELKSFSAVINSKGNIEIYIAIGVAVFLTIVVLILFYLSNKKDNTKERFIAVNDELDVDKKSKSKVCNKHNEE